MKKITKKVWAYAINFLLRAIMFNVALVFAIIALVYYKDGLTKWAYVAIASVGTWVAQQVIGHSIWACMKVEERALYFAIRKHGKKVVELTEAEVKHKTGQPDIHEIFTDTDSGLEIKMIVNGTATLVNVFIGIKWLNSAIHFHKDATVFKWHIEEGNKK